MSIAHDAVKAHTYIRKWKTASKPVLLRCDDDKEYVVKGQQAGRMIYNDQVIGKLGKRMEAPVPKVVLVDLPEELINAEPEMSHMTPGVSHGSLFITNSTERENDIMHTDITENVARFARLAALFGWVHANDRQFIYENSRPHLVYSVDHGHFLPKGPAWTVASLNSASSPELDQKIVQALCDRHWPLGRRCRPYGINHR